MLGNVLRGFLVALSPVNLLCIAGGTAIGIVLGAFPGLDATVGAALFIPLTYAMGPTPAILLLVGMYGGAVYGKRLSATRSSLKAALSMRRSSRQSPTQGCW